LLSYYHSSRIDSSLSSMIAGLHYFITNFRLIFHKDEVHL